MLSLLAAAPSARAASTTFLLTRPGQAEVRFSVEAPLDTIGGLAYGVLGAAQLDPESGATTGRLVVDLGSFHTGLDLRDEDLRDQFFETSRFPNAVLELKQVEWAQKPAPGANAQGTAIFSLNLHGVTRSLAAPITAKLGERDGHPAVHVRTTFDLKLSDYQIQRPRRLFLKLGDAAHVTFEGTLLAPDAPAPAQASGAGEIRLPEVKRALISVAQVPRKPAPPKFKFGAGSVEGKGERLFADRNLGGAGNALTCASCHPVVDERGGIYAGGGSVRPSHTLYDAAHRASLWQGLAPTPGKAASLCVRLFMLNPQGLGPAQETQLEAFLKAIAPDDAVPALSYEALALTRRTALAKATSGDKKAGKALVEKFCAGCHGKGRVRPELTVGLYEPDYLVQRVRWLQGHDARQMPPMYLDRLVDSDLRHIVTYLAGEKSERIFKRKRT
jgi:mono/diheme cytochrome c family protein/polyisoprenoid-binding protein YceI